jgi:alpha-2-macroglobulin
VAFRSGEPLWAMGLKTERSVSVYQELRDRKVAMFIDHLQQGLWEIRYTLRAETPGSFHALPLLGEAMYVPEIRANGDEVRVTVGE